MGLEVQPYNYTFSLLPWNCKRSILTFKMLGWLGLSVHLGNQLGRQVHKALGELRKLSLQDYKEKKQTAPQKPVAPFPSLDSLGEGRVSTVLAPTGPAASLGVFSGC